jgi:hypothetical protein
MLGALRVNGAGFTLPRKWTPPHLLRNLAPRDARGSFLVSDPGPPRCSRRIAQRCTSSLPLRGREQRVGVVASGARRLEGMLLETPARPPAGGEAAGGELVVLILLILSIPFSYFLACLALLAVQLLFAFLGVLGVPSTSSGQAWRRVPVPSRQPTRNRPRFARCSRSNPERVTRINSPT